MSWQRSRCEVALSLMLLAASVPGASRCSTYRMYQKLFNTFDHQKSGWNHYVDSRCASRRPTLESNFRDTLLPRLQNQGSEWGCFWTPSSTPALSTLLIAPCARPHIHSGQRLVTCSCFRSSIVRVARYSRSRWPASPSGARW